MLEEVLLEIERISQNKFILTLLFVFSCGFLPTIMYSSDFKEGIRIFYTGIGCFSFCLAMGLSLFYDNARRIFSSGVSKICFAIFCGTTVAFVFEVFFLLMWLFIPIIKIFWGYFPIASKIAFLLYAGISIGQYICTLLKRKDADNPLKKTEIHLNYLPIISDVELPLSNDTKKSKIITFPGKYHV